MENKQEEIKKCKVKGCNNYTTTTTSFKDDLFCQHHRELWRKNLMIHKLDKIKLLEGQEKKLLDRFINNERLINRGVDYI